MKKGFFITVIFISIISIEAFSQSFYSRKRERKFIGSVGTGTSTYYGELSNDNDYMDAKPNLNFGLQYFVTNRIGIRTEITWFQLSGNDKEADSEGRVLRNLSFISNNYEINVEGLVNLMPKGQRYYQRKPINFYGFVGFGMMFFNPKAEAPSTVNEAGKKVALHPLKTEGVAYNRFVPIIPFGLGGKMKVSPFLNIVIEGGFRKTFTDYLDDASTTFQDPASLESDLARAMADRTQEIPGDIIPPRQEGDIRGNPGKKDSYFIANIKVEYYLSPKGLFSGSNRSRPVKNKYNNNRRRK
ncbi:MAG: hypothetical protein OEX22_07365 [Cyclobacteriaceae bacterium]|nr:hypothetical protein [Cyclobacteriaceae bacterium]